MRSGGAALLLALVVVPAFVSPSAAKQVAEAAVTSRRPAALLAFEDRLFKADVDRDVASIQRGFADDAIFVHANGVVQTKADYVAAVRSNRTSPSSVTGSDRVVRISGTIGLVRGTKSLVLGDLHLSGTYLTAYVWGPGGWQMLWSQSSPAPKTTEGQK